MQLGTKKRDSENEGPGMQHDVVIFPQPLPWEVHTLCKYHRPPKAVSLGGALPDDVYFVPLAAIRDPGTVLSTLARDHGTASWKIACIV